MKKILSILLSLLMVISIVPFASFCVSAEESDAIEVRTIEDLYNINNNMSGNYKLMNDIDMTEATAEGGDWDFMGNGWDPIGSGGVYGDTAFTGTFNGNGYSIIGMRIDVTTLPSGTGAKLFLGLFSAVSGTISNLKIDDSEIAINVDYNYSGSSNDTMYGGAVCGYLNSTGIIENCASNSTVNIYNRYYCCRVSSGGITGYNAGTINFCYNIGNIIGKTGYYDYNAIASVGGVSGDSSSSSAVNDCYNTGTITAPQSMYSYACGISTGYGKINRCYNTGAISASSKKPPQAIVIGGTATNCYYLDTTTANSQTGAKSLTEEQMKLQSMYSGFDFENTWIIDSSTSYKYPQLRSNRQDTLKEIDIAEFVSTPTKTTYFTDDKISAVGGKLLVYYTDGTSEYIDITEDMLSGYDMTATGFQTVTVTYRGQVLSYSINVVQRPNLLSLTLISEPTVKEFVRGTTFDFSGCQAYAKYDNSMTETIDITPQMITGIDINKSGEQTATFEYFGQSVTFNITVIPVKVTSIEVVTPPTKTTYIEGQTPNYAGLTVKAVYNNGTEKEITDFTIGEVETTVGIRPVTITHGLVSTTFNVKFIAKTAILLSVTKSPDKTTYVQGQKFDKTGMIVEATFDNGTTEEVTDYTVGNMPQELSYQTVDILYQDVKTSVTVYIIEKDIQSIAIKTLPTKTEYIEGEDFDESGLEVIAQYNDGTEGKITGYTLTGNSTAKVGTVNVTVTYSSYTAKFSIKVIEKTLVKIEIEKPEKLSYILDEEFDETGLKVTAYYDNGKSYEVTDYTVSGFTGEKGTNAITVTFGGQSKEFTVTVHVPRSEWTIVTNATCIKDGSKVLYCEDCDTILKTETINALDHDWATNEILKKPTCEKEGTRIYYCSRCDETKETSIKALGHDFSDDWTVDKNSTCSQTGLKSHHCSRCSAVSDETIIEKEPHTTKWVTDKQPTCTTLGHKYQYCTVCEETLANADIPMIDHDYNTKVIAPTCTEQGYTLYVCVDCGASKKGNYTFALGHTEVIDKGYSPTCTKDGLTDGKHCSVCGEILVSKNKIEALGHNVITVGVKSPSYIAYGYNGDKKCSVCNTVISKGNTIAKLKLKTPAVKYTGAKGKLKVTYKKVVGATGFEVRYNVKGKWKTKLYTTNSSAKKVISLKKGKYKVQIRAFVKQSGKKAYSAWTNIKNISIK